MENNKSPLILVVGGTGTQGGNVARELLKNGHTVRVLTRNTYSDAAVEIQKLGAQVVHGDLAVPDSLSAVMEGVDAIFSAQYTDPTDPTVELRNASNMVAAAQRVGVKQVVHTSVVGSNIFPRWDKSIVLDQYWKNKFQVEELVRKGDFPCWTILHPSFFMENFTEALAKYMAPELKKGKLFGMLEAGTPIKMNNGEDTAIFARAAFENPEKFSAKDINIASDELSMVQIAVELTEMLGKKIIYQQVSKQEGLKRGLLEGTLISHEWMNEVKGWGFDINETRSFGLPIKSFRSWLQGNRSRIVVD